MSVSTEIKNHVLQVVTDRLRDATNGQRVRVAERILAGYEANPAALAFATTELGAAHDVEQLLRTDPELVCPVPDAHDILTARAAEHVETYGSQPSPEQRMQWYRDASAMSPDQRLATGIKARAKGEAAQAPAPTATPPLHELDPGSDVFDKIIHERMGAAPGTLTAIMRNKYVKALQQSSQTFNQARDTQDAVALDNIEQAKPLSPAERLTQFRLAQKAK